MSKLAFILIIVALLAAAIISPSVVANTFAKSSDGDGGGSDSDSGADKPRTSGHKKDDGGHLAVPGSPAVLADNKPKHKDKDNGGGLIVPGSPVVTADSGSNDANSGYNDNNIKKFDTSKSAFSIGGSDGKVVEYKPGFNETFYNSTLPYCFAVQSGSCYDSSTGQVIP